MASLSWWKGYSKGDGSKVLWGVKVADAPSKVGSSPPADSALHRNMGPEQPALPILSEISELSKDLSEIFWLLKVDSFLKTLFKENILVNFGLIL